jgi:hypothetical protein
VPSDLGFRVDEQGQQIPVFKNKDEVEKAAKDADMPTTLIWPGGMAESTLSMGLVLSIFLLAVQTRCSFLLFLGYSALITLAIELFSRVTVGTRP